MERVKLTPAQVEALEKWKGMANRKQILIAFTGEGKQYGWLDELECLKSLSFEEMALALCDWYEIEEPFKVGDWVVFKSGLISKITKTDISHRKEQLIQVDNIEPGEDADDEYIPVSHVVRKAIAEEIAAEKERRKWKSIGREVNDYHKGDIVMVKNYADVVEFVDSIGPYLRGLKRYVDVNEIELTCPVEHRFDMKEAE
jgi:hypothetical protein